MCRVDFDTVNLSKDYLVGLPAIFKKAMQDLHGGLITPTTLSKDLVKAIAAELWKGVSLKLDTDLTHYAPTSSHYKLIKKLESNIYVFSGFKTHQMLQEATLMLKKPNGFKPFTEFMQDVTKINNTYNLNYLKAEYDNAMVSAEMAAKWEEFQDTAQAFPLLKFVATVDDHTTAICRQLDGIIKPINWDGWKKYFLPLHWGERSNIIKVVSGAISPVHENDLPKPPDMFGGNIAIDGVIFPDTHPYFKVQNPVKKQVAKSINKIKP